MMAGTRRQQVMPGDVITSGPYRPEANTATVDGSIVSTAVGMSEIYEDTVRVIPMAGMYYPLVNDFVIAMITSHTSLAWEAEMNSCYVGFLPASDVFGRDFASHADALTSRLKKGDLIAARVANFDRTRDPLLTVADRDLGKIDAGELVQVTPGNVSRLIGKRGSMIQAIETATDSVVTIGQNGWVVISCESPDGLLKAKKAVMMIEAQSNTPNLTERVKSLLASG